MIGLMITRKTVASVVGLVIFLGLLHYTTPRLLEVTVNSQGDQPRHFGNPFQTQYPPEPGRSVIVAGEITRPVISQRQLRIVPVGCVTYVRLNGEKLRLDGVPPEALCDGEEGFLLRIWDFSRPGSNTLELGIRAHAGAIAGVHVRRSYRDGLALTLLLACFLCLGVLLLGMLRSFERKTAIVLMLGLLLRLGYFVYTDPTVRSHDEPGHVQYIVYVAYEHKLPQHSYCWECYQPPGYYLPAAGVFSAVNSLTGPFEAWRAVQLLSLAAFFVFLVAGAKILELLFARAALLPTALFVFWPSGVFHSIRIGNDPFLYAAYAMALLYLCRWMRESKPWLLDRAALAGAIALIIKANGLLVLAVAGCAFVLKWMKERDRATFFRRHLPAMLIAVAGMALFYAVTTQGLGMNIGHVQNFKSFRGMRADLMVGNSPSNYLIFDPVLFVKEGFTTTEQDWGGRQYFWNFLLKTSLVGEWMMPFERSKPLAQLLGALMLIFMMYMAAGFIRKKPWREPVQVIGLLNLMISFAAVAWYRIVYPAAPNNDFRFILPALLAMVSLIQMGIQAWEGTKYSQLARWGQWVGWGFVAVSVAFFLNPFV